MCAKVHLQAPEGAKTLVTVLTCEGLLTRMHPNVNFQCVLMTEPLATIRTLVVLLCMPFDVFL